MSKNIDLHEALKYSYADKSKQMTAFKKQGYNYDSMLSNHNQQVYYNPNEKNLIVNVAGTHNLRDVGTDVYLAAGKLKNTNRYKEANKIFKQAKQKYGPTNTKVNDKVYTHNKGATIGQKIRSNETHFRTKGDLVSLLNANSARTKNLSNPNLFKDPYNAHLVNTLKYKKIKV